MTRSRALVLAGLLLAGLALAPRGSSGADTPPSPTRWATDEAGFLSAGTRQELDSRLEAYERRTGHQVLVWIGRTSGGVPIEDFAVRAFAAWRVGRKGLDDGVVLFVLAEDRQLRIEVGYGLEGQVPDALAARIIQQVIVPRLQAGDPDGAIRAGVDALLATIDGTAAQSGLESPPGALPGPSGPASELSTGQKILIGLAILAFLVLLITNPGLALYLLFTFLSGGRGGGGGFRGGGGFSGGGGRSGGGGASGSW